MLQMILKVARDFPTFERPVRLALIMGVMLLAVTGVFVFILPQETRLAACFGALGLTVVMQIAVLYAYRNMVTPLARAQRDYLAGRYQDVVEILTPLRETDSLDAKGLTLLGNTFRQLGDLPASSTVLYEALNKSPQHHFALYAIGRTLLSEGDYASAAGQFSLALENGSPDGVYLDLAEAQWRAGDSDAALVSLGRVPLAETQAEPVRAWILGLLRLKLLNQVPDAAGLAGDADWQAVAGRLAHTPYGQALLHDIDDMRRARTL